MAITIRKTEDHTQMLDDLKKLTGANTASGALIAAGYIALEKSKEAKELKDELRDLRWEHSDVKEKVGDFFEAFEELKDVVK